jgi:tetratricopeptide (TPR) repeat protein
VPPDKYEFIQRRLVEAEIARRKGQDADLARAYTDLSQYFQSINDMEIAIIYLEKLRDYALFTSDLVREAQALKEIGRLFKEAGNLENCLHFCEECLSVSVSIGDGVAEAQAALIEAYRSYSQSLITRGDGHQAIDYLNKSLKVASDSGVLLSLAVCHQELGTCYRQLEMLDSAIEHFDKAFQIYKSYGNVEGQSTAVSALATSYKYIGKIELAVENFKILHELANQTGNAEDKAMSCLTMGKILWESDQKEDALVWFEKNFDISLELDDLSVIEDSRVSLGVSLANYRMQRFTELVRNPEETPYLLDWEIRRYDQPFRSINKS